MFKYLTPLIVIVRMINNFVVYLYRISVWFCNLCFVSLMMTDTCTSHKYVKHFYKKKYDFYKKYISFF